MTTSPSNGQALNSCFTRPVPNIRITSSQFPEYLNNEVVKEEHDDDKPFQSLRRMKVKMMLQRELMNQDDEDSEVDDDDDYN